MADANLVERDAAGEKASREARIPSERDSIVETGFHTNERRLKENRQAGQTPSAPIVLQIELRNGRRPEGGFRYRQSRYVQVG